MKSRETLIRLKKFQVEERRRTVTQIESMISGFERISVDLERDIKIEQDRSGIHDPAHFAYPTYAKAAIQRRDNLKRSAQDLKIRLEDAKAALGEAFEEMRKVELLGERDQIRERTEEELPRPSERVHDARPHGARPRPGPRFDPPSRANHGLLDCCAHAASGHAATAPPNVAKNFRRPM
jgi:flagellar export protein FliJ